MRFITNPATNLYSTSIYQTLSPIDSQSNIKVSILSNKCNTLFRNLPKTQFFSLKLQYPSTITSQFANCIIYSSGLKETLLNSVKAACCAGFCGGWGWGALERRGDGDWIESGKYESIFFRTLFRSLPYTTHRTFYSS